MPRIENRHISKPAITSLDSHDHAEKKDKKDETKSYSSKLELVDEYNKESKCLLYKNKKLLESGMYHKNLSIDEDFLKNDFSQIKVKVDYNDHLQMKTYSKIKTVPEIFKSPGFESCSTGEFCPNTDGKGSYEFTVNKTDLENIDVDLFVIESGGLNIELCPA